MNTITPARVQDAAEGVHQLEGPIDAFPAITSALATTSLLTAEERRRATGISLTCVQCGYDLGKKDDTCALDQCPGCAGKRFRFRIAPESNRHWLRIKEQLVKTTPELRQAEAPAAGATLPKAQTRWRPVIAAVLLGTVAFFLIRYWLYGAPIPLIHKPEKYEFVLPPNSEPLSELPQ